MCALDESHAAEPESLGLISKEFVKTNCAAVYRILPVFLCLAGPRVSSAQSPPLPRWWAGGSAGAGFASVPTTSGDTVFEGSPHLVLRLDAGIRVTPYVGAGLEWSNARATFAGDCIPGFSVCAPPVSYTALTVNGSYVAPAHWPTLTAGVGRYQLQGYDRTAKGVAIGCHVGLGHMILRRTNGGIGLGLRATYLPTPPGEPITMVSVHVALRGWSAEVK